jgi:hypothetical protein
VEEITCCRARWDELQQVASNTIKKAQQLTDVFVKFLGNLGCAEDQTSLFAATPIDVVWFFMGKDSGGRTIVHSPTCKDLRKGSALADRTC